VTLTDERRPADPANAWRTETPGPQGWARTARPDDPHKYFMVSADCHANEPPDFLSSRLEPEYARRLPRIEVDENGDRWVVTEGYRPQKLRDRSDFGPEDQLRNDSGRTPQERLADHAADGVDVEIMFPNKGLSMWATDDARFAMAQCRAWNRWAHETFSEHFDRILPTACLATGDLEGSTAEISWAAEKGFKVLTLPCKPIWGPHDADQLHYNKPEFEPMWSLIEEVDLPVTFHVSTGRDPRAARGDGGAVINYVTHSLSPTMEPLVHLCASGVIERHPGIRFGAVEAGIGWVPWMLVAMDEAYMKHHMWAFPKLAELPSVYFRSNGFASFQEDKPGLDLAVEHDLVDNFLWANDYPHHEGSWPHSAAAIEREMGHLDDEQRARILGLNAARIFKIPMPVDTGPAGAAEVDR
jgi:predicted TIM-barrel fold metal-dependent hydrolase